MSQAVTSKEYKGIEVIGAGWGRTGTNTLMTALEILGFDPCYHMLKVFKYSHADFWRRAYLGEKVDFDEVFGPNKVRASCDFPSAYLWKEQLKKYPDAKVILTVRDPEKWYESCMKTIFVMMAGNPNAPLGVKVVNFLGMGPIPGFIPMTRAMNAKVFKGNIFERSVIEEFKAYNESVKADCPKDKLLVFEVSQGWEPLCAFLGVPVPDVPFPRVNDTAEFQSHINTPNRIGLAILAIASAAAVAAVAVGISFFQ